MVDLVTRARQIYTHWNNPPSPCLPDKAEIVIELSDRIEELERQLAEADASIAGFISALALASAGPAAG